MALLEISVPDSPDSGFTVILDSISYDLRLQWNGRDESWYMFLGLSNQEYLFKSKLTSGWDILSEYRAYEDTPKGVIVAVDNEKSFGRLQRDSFTSGRFALYYFTEDSTEQLREAGYIR